MKTRCALRRLASWSLGFRPAPRGDGAPRCCSPAPRDGAPRFWPTRGPRESIRDRPSRHREFHLRVSYPNSQIICVCCSACKPVFITATRKSASGGLERSAPRHGVYPGIRERASARLVRPPLALPHRARFSRDRETCASVENIRLESGFEHCLLAARGGARLFFGLVLVLVSNSAPPPSRFALRPLTHAAEG